MTALALLMQLPALAVQSVLLSWNASTVTGVAGYKIYYGPASHDYTTVVDAGDATNVTISGLADGTTYYFSATTYDASNNESAYSAEVVFVAPVSTNQNSTTQDTPVTVDTPPTNAPGVLNVVGNVTATTNPADADSVILSWTPSTDAGVVGYQVFSGQASGHYSLSQNVGLQSSLVITGLVAGTTNYFAVREFDAAWDESGMSAEAQLYLPLPVSLPPTSPPVVIVPVTNPAPVLNVVGNVTVTTNPADGDSVILSWTPSTDAGVAGYQIFSGQASGNYSLTQNVGLVSSLVVTGLVAGTTNYFAMEEFDTNLNTSAMSSEVQWYVPLPVSLPPTNLPPVLNVVGNLMMTSNPADVHSVILSWTPSTDAGVAGYQVFSGQASGNYSVSRNIGLVSSLVVTGLVAGTTNYFAVREFDGNWNESVISAEVQYFVPLPANKPPTLNPLANLTLNINAAMETVDLSGISSGATNAKATIKITATSSNPGLIPTPKVSYTSPKSTGSLTFRPANNQTGTATITVKVNDGATNNNVVTQSFTVTVVNEALLAALPKFSTQLKGGRTLTNKTVTLSVTVAGRAPFRYQWKFNGTNLPGQTAASLTIKSAKAANTGAYTVQVSNSVGVTNSAVAMLTVITNTTPTMTAPATASNGQFSFQIPGVAGLQYVVEATADFKTWTPVATNTAPFTYTETNAASYSQRYYRSYYLP